MPASDGDRVFLADSQGLEAHQRVDGYAYSLYHANAGA
jgi:hypothetical protein